MNFEHVYHVPPADHGLLHEQRCDYADLILSLDGSYGEFFDEPSYEAVL